MNSNAAPNKTRMLQLLADRATEGLDMHATKNLNELLSSHPHFGESDFELVAAAINLAMLPPVAEPLPGPLLDRILADAGRFFGTMECGEAP